MYKGVMLTVQSWTGGFLSLVLRIFIRQCLDVRAAVGRAAANKHSYVSVALW
jgi:hypothetical protein